MVEKEFGLPTEEIKEITEPRYLEPGQNFYAQYPFNVLLPKVARFYDGSNPIYQKGKQLSVPRLPAMEEDLSTVITGISRGFYQASPSEQRKGIAVFSNFYMKYKLLSRLAEKYKGKIEDSNVSLSLLFSKAVTNLREELDMYPVWWIYVGAKNTSSLYSLDGKYHPHPSTRIEGMLPISYLSWLEERQKLNDNVRRGLTIQALNNDPSQRSWKVTITRPRRSPRAKE